MHLYIAAYDISADPSRRRVASILSRYGQRLQRSVFQLWIGKEEIKQLQREVGVHLSERDDFELIPIDARPDRVRVRWRASPNELDGVVVF